MIQMSTLVQPHNSYPPQSCPFQNKSPADKSPEAFQTQLETSFIYENSNSDGNGSITHLKRLSSGLIDGFEIWPQSI
ncbi:hypothetical protein JTE90_024970 [Oedothorax gibbosus]|uniref:Uncharacterized protein n=1 Tax=Oedothorax gibbosus TaxID=931172 RepID=A0AAV6VTD5_9ARAC|nr:hypothetical protein JTE90_024970 [Oedothorax gibbosus]